jgi:hypothetical protein
MRRQRPLVLSVACAVLVAGCGIHDPYRRLRVDPSPTAIRATTPAAAPDANEADGPKVGAPAAVPHGTPTAQAALVRFAELFTNWTAAGLPGRARQLAAISTGQARSEALNMRGRRDVLVRYRVTNTGSVVAIARGQGEERGRWAIVTNELTSGTGPYLGLPATSHVTWATVVHERGGYVVSTWYPGS